MIPILQTASTVIGFLPDVLSCAVTEERNGVYELTMTYPVSGPMFSSLAVDKYIKAKPNDTADPQLFRIYEITKPINGIVTVNCEHISYALTHYPVSGVTISGTAAQAINALLSNANLTLSTPHGFIVSTTSMSAIKNFSIRVGSVRSALGGVEGSILDVYGGEYEFDNKTIKLHQHRGTNTGVIISYGKNMTDIKVTTSMESAYTHLFPYAVKDDALILIANRKIAVPNTSGIAERILIKDFSSSFDSEEEVTPATLLSKANAWLSDNDINSPSINVTVSFLHLWQSPEYASLSALEKVSLCDTVTVRHKDLGVDIKAQVIKTVYDTLGEKYEKIELGSAKANFVDTIKQTTDKVNDALALVEKMDPEGMHSQITEEYLAAIDTATKAITGYSGGYVVLNPSQHPQELLIMNTADKSTATKLWRWNINGLGYSSNGYNGPYTTAITMNGAINADFITTGTLTANIIRAGILTSANGQSFFNLDTGLIQTNNAQITGGSIKIGGAGYYTEIAAGSLGQFADGGTKIGGLVPVFSGSESAQCIYFRDNGATKAVDISYQDLDTGNFPMIASFRTDSIEFYHNLNFHNGVITTARNLFAGLTHTRQDTPINRGYYDYRVKNGVGVITSHYESLSFTTYKHSSVTTKTESGKTYYARTSLTSASSIYRFTNNISCGGDVSRVYVSFYANSYGKAYVYLGYTDSGGQLYYGPLLATPWNSEVSYTGTVDLPSNAVSWCLMCQPDTGYSSYWCGIRSVSMRNYSQDATAAIEVSDMGGEITGRLDAFGSWGEAVGGLRMTKGSSTSSILELGSGEMWFNGKPILEWLQNLDDRVSALEY